MMIKITCAIAIIFFGLLSGCTNEEAKPPETFVTPVNKVKEKASDAQEKLKQREAIDPQKQLDQQNESPSPSP